MPLTTSGISIQILASIQAQRRHAQNCTKNDCKVVVNHLIRKFSEPLNRANESEVRRSAKAAGNPGNTITDHAVPVIVILEELLIWPDEHLEISPENVERLEEFLRRSLLTVEITREEDLELSRRGLQRAMPICWKTLGHPWHLDPLARYKECEIEVLAVL